MMSDSTLLPSAFLVLPFVALLLMVATGPVLYPHFWHRYYTKIAPALALLVMGYYVVVLGDCGSPIAAVAEYIQFIVLIAALYVVSGSILIELNGGASPRNNLCLLWVGAVLANLIGTTGASMLLIRPYMRLNKKRLLPYHIVFFIFMVSNVGGALTPIGDPPLFLGFLKGVPFFWTLKVGVLPWLMALVLLSVVFYGLERQAASQEVPVLCDAPGILVQGKRFLLLFPLVVGAVLLDPNKWGWIPCLAYGGHRFSFVRELILLAMIVGVYYAADQAVLKRNKFSFEPLKEVVFIFMGIFGTMVPAMAWIGHTAAMHKDAIDGNLLYWATGILSSVLDNAPTYVSFLTAGMQSKGLDIHLLTDVATYAKTYAPLLRATSLAAVFFGAMTYVGNGPNFMVRAIAEEQGVKMPSFGSYVWRYALRFLFPVLLVVWALFVWRTGA